MGLKGSDVAGISIGGGFLGLGAAWFYHEWDKRKIIRSYTSEVQTWQGKYKAAIADNDLSPVEKEALNAEARRLDEKEKEIERKGFVAELIDSLAELGIVVSVGYITAKVVHCVMRRFPPPNFPCPKCGKKFTSEGALRKHMTREHAELDEAQIPLAQEAYRKLRFWTRNLLEHLSGVGEWLMGDWETLPHWVLIAVGIAAIALIILSRGALAPALGPIASLVPGVAF